MSNRGAGAIRAPFALYSSRIFFPLVVVATHDNIPVFLLQSPLIKNNVTGSNVIVQYFGS